MTPREPLDTSVLVVAAAVILALAFLSWLGSCTPTAVQPEPTTAVWADRHEEQFWVNVRVLRRSVPTPYPVTVDLVDSLSVEGVLGVTVTKNGRTHIRVLRDLSALSREDLEHVIRTSTLIHEWGHAVADARPGHGAMWGAGMAEGYVAVYGGR